MSDRPILIVDDSPTQLEALRGLLDQAELPVVAAKNGEEALDLARRHRPELVLSDVVMPGMSGFELCRHIKKELQGDDQPSVVLLTSLADPRDIVRGLEAGADNYITKPYEPEHLIQRVRSMLDNRALRREGRAEQGSRVRFMGEDFTLKTVPEEMLEMLLGSFEELTRTNRALRQSQQALADAAQRELEREQRARADAEATTRRMEQLVREAEAATRARDEVLATVSHDLKNPVGTIFTSASLLLEMELTKELQERQLNIIRRTAERMTRLIQDLLDVSKMEAGHFSVEAQPVPVRVLIEDAFDMLQPLAASKQISLVDAVSARDVVVSADINRVQRVFSNLVGNAVKFTPEGGTITVRADGENGHVAFAVEDEGPGIPEENLERIFDRFWQASRTAREGAGLGLAIARGIVEAHGGRIWADSEPPHGSTFHFTLPTA